LKNGITLYNEILVNMYETFQILKRYSNETFLAFSKFLYDKFQSSISNNQVNYDDLDNALVWQT